MNLVAWLQTWQELGASGGDDGLRRRIIACWSEPHRHYHTLQHLRECLAQFEGVHHKARHPGEVALALWFHDAFYDPQRDDNEARSADWARDSVVAAGLADDIADRVHSLVMMTRHGEAVATDLDSQLLVDIDLSIFGADARRFDESCEQVRREYVHVPDDDYREGRTEILRGFLTRPKLYHTRYFSSLLEQRARANLQRELDRLAG
ncbi:MAG: N-methyl-D-aspartate receptor NMDAR2C subunit [Ramlibacter sp.]